MTQNQGNDQNVIIDAILNSVASTEYWTAIITVFSCWLAKAGWDKYQEAKKPNSRDKELWDYIDNLLPIRTINLWRDSDANRRFNNLVSKTINWVKSNDCICEISNKSFE